LLKKKTLLSGHQRPFAREVKKAFKPEFLNVLMILLCQAFGEGRLQKIIKLEINEVIDV